MDEDARIFICPACGFTDSLHPSLKLHQVHALCPKVNLLLGEMVTEVGHELHALLAELGSQPTSGCGCAAKAAQMNAWGIDGCRDHREDIVEWLKEAYTHATWLETIRAGWRGLWVVNPLEPFGSLVDEAIRRAEAKGKGK
jgi:hypothetical protein